jgi:hypothetical protein
MPHVHTEVDGGKFYGAALTYHRAIVRTDVQLAKKKTLTTYLAQSPSTKNHLSSQASLGKANLSNLMEPTCICLLSHYPFFSVLRALLREVYWCVHSRAAHVPIERLVERIVNDLPLPSLGRVRVRVRAALWPNGAAGYGRTPEADLLQRWLTHEQLALPDGSSALAATVSDGLYYSRPAATHFALCDFPLRTLFDCLGVFNVVRLVAALLGESKVVVISQQSSLLTVACETLTALMYPFQWPYVCLPILPRSLTDLMQAPTPYLLGMHPSFLEHVNSEIDLTDVIVVNLDVGDVRGPVPDKLPRVLVDIVAQKLVAALYPKVANFDLAFSNADAPLEDATTAAAAAVAPPNGADAAAPKKTLDVSGMTAIDSSTSDNEADKAATSATAAAAIVTGDDAHNSASSDASADDADASGAAPSTARSTRAKQMYERMYAATFDAVQTPTLGQTQRDDATDRRVQAAFLSLFVTLLYDYHAYIQYVRRYPVPVAVFNKATFVRDNGVAARFLASLVDTQAFAVFLEERHAVSENLFDIAVQHAHTLMEVETKQRFGAPTTTLKMYRAALTLPELLSRLDGDILRLPCLASDITETYVVPGPDCHDFGSAAVFDYAAPGAPAFPAFDDNRFTARASLVPAASALTSALLDSEPRAPAPPVNAALTRYTRIAPALLRRAMSLEVAEAAAAATMEWNGLLRSSTRVSNNSGEESSTQQNKSKRRQISTATLSREGFIAAGDAAESLHGRVLRLPAREQAARPRGADAAAQHAQAGARARQFSRPPARAQAAPDGRGAARADRLVVRAARRHAAARAARGAPGRRLPDAARSADDRRRLLPRARGARVPLGRAAAAAGVAQHVLLGVRRVQRRSSAPSCR